MTSGNVPIIEVTDENFEAMWPAISNAITQASFIGLDCELSGLGNRSKLNSPEIDMRYQNTKEIAQDYSMVSLGISCFSCHSCSSLDLQTDGEVKTHNYLVQTFNVLTLCSTKFMVECDSLKFLLSHGFDFNKQYSHGLPYVRGEDTKDKKSLSVKNIFHLMIKLCKPIVLHNGFIDLMFLYQSFYADLPKRVETFAADLLELFPAGIYDTKYISEFYQSFSATFLEYIFKKLQLENDVQRQKGTWHCRIKFPPYPETGIPGLKWYPYLQVFDDDVQDTQPLCDSYKFHGWCSKTSSCKMSHNVNRIAKELNRAPSCKRKKTQRNAIAYSSVAQLINIKKRKMEELGKKKKEPIPNQMTGSDVTKTDEIVVLENNSNRIQEIGKVGNKNNTLEFKCNSEIVTEDQNDLIDITEDNNLKTNSQVRKNDQENDVTILDEDEDSIQEVFNAEEGEGRMKNECSGSGNTKHENSVCAETRGYSSMCDTNDNPASSTDRNCGNEEKGSTELDNVSKENKDCVSSKSELKPEIKDSNGHSAGYDAFMTGYIFACDVASLGQLPDTSSFENAKYMNFEHLVGKVYLIGKEFPFLVRSSDYASTSSSHDRIIKLIRTC